MTSSPALARGIPNLQVVLLTCLALCGGAWGIRGGLYNVLIN